MNYYVDYSDGIVQGKNFKSLKAACIFATGQIRLSKIVDYPKLKYINIFLNDARFHSTTQEEFLLFFWGKGHYWDNMSKSNPKLLEKEINLVRFELKYL